MSGTVSWLNFMSPTIKAVFIEIGLRVLRKIENGNRDIKFLEYLVFISRC